MRPLQKGMLIVALIGMLVAFANAQSFFDGFEPPTYAPGILTGQNSWYRPASSTDWSVYLYSGLPAWLGSLGSNPGGGQQFIAARKDTPGFFPRAQKDFNWGARTIWLVSYDVAVNFDPSVSADGLNYDNIASFSLQPATANYRYFIDLFQWVSPQVTPNDGWRMTWVVSDSGGSASIVSFDPPNPFHGLQINKWYRRFVAFRLDDSNPDARHLVKVGIRDLATGDTFSTPVGPTADFPYWYLVNRTAAIPTAFRFFVGGGTGTNEGNILAVDNVAFTAFSFGDVDMNGCVDDADLLAVLFAFGNTGAFMPEDTNGDGTVDDADLLNVLFEFGNGC